MLWQFSDQLFSTMSEENWQTRSCSDAIRKGLCAQIREQSAIPGLRNNWYSAKMSLLVDLARRMAPVINVGFKPLATKQTVHNAFVQANVPFVKVDEDFNATLAPDQMLCSDGVLKRPKVTATWNESDNKLVLQHAAEKVSGLCALDDKIYAGLYETGLREAVLVELGNRKSETVEQTELPEEWNKENLCIYAFAISLSKRNASPSVCVELS